MIAPKGEEGGSFSGPPPSPVILTGDHHYVIVLSGREWLLATVFTAFLAALAATLEAHLEIAEFQHVLPPASPIQDSGYKHKGLNVSEWLLWELTAGKQLQFPKSDTEHGTAPVEAQHEDVVEPKIGRHFKDDVADSSAGTAVFFGDGAHRLMARNVGIDDVNLLHGQTAHPPTDWS